MASPLRCSLHNLPQLERVALFDAGFWCPSNLPKARRRSSASVVRSLILPNDNGLRHHHWLYAIDQFCAWMVDIAPTVEDRIWDNGHHPRRSCSHIVAQTKPSATFVHF